MNVLFITHYFDPDSGAASNRLTRLAHQLQARGHQVSVLTTMPHYPTGVIPDGYRGRWTVIEDRDGVRVIQVWLWVTRSPRIVWRLLSQISFMFALMLRGLFVKKPDVIFIENQPIFTGVAGWLISKFKRTDYLLNVSDYWPEYLVVAGVVAETSLTYRVFKALANITQRQASIIVVLLADLMKKIEARIGPVKSGHTINNAVDLAIYSDQESEHEFRRKHGLGDRRLVTFLGVLGPHIDLGTMLTTARDLAAHDVTVLFVGTGAQKDQLTAALAQPEYSHCRRIEWIDKSELPGFWMASYITYWALHDNELDKMRFQAKLYEALASGTPPVIAVNGLMSEFLADSEAGIAVHPGDSDKLTEAIVSLLQDRDTYDAMSQRGRAYAQANFDLEAHVSAYERLLQQIATGNALQ